jgi:hypothetical protein
MNKRQGIFNVSKEQAPRQIHKSQRPIKYKVGLASVDPPSSIVVSGTVKLYN